MAVGPIVLLILIFSARLVATNGFAQAQARQIAANAVLDPRAPISVAQFMQDPNREARLNDMKALDSRKRADFVTAHGWARMPGEKESDSRVAVEYATRLMEIEM